MKLRNLVVILLFINISLYAQVPRTVLLEYATNASCGPCASANPASYKYLESNYDRMVSIWYHAWWPGSGDPMYIANKPENENRIGYYNIPWVPYSVIDGILYDAAGDANTLGAQAESRWKNTSPIKLHLKSNIVGDSIEVTLTMVVYGAVTQKSLKLQTVITESIISYPTPPGSNGETVFPHVFRKFIGGVNGIDISELNIGDSLTYIVKDKIDGEWNRDVLAVVAFLQSQSSKEVVQAAMDKRYHEIVGDVPSIELIAKNQKVSYPLSVTNSQDDMLDLVIKLNVVNDNQNWIANLLKDGNAIDSIVVSLGSGESVNFELNIEAGDVTDFIKLSVIASNSTGFATTKDYSALIKAGEVMLIDDDGGKEYNKNFERALKNSGNEFTKVNHEILSKVKDMFDMPNEFKSILWNIGDNSPTIELSDFTWIIAYLNAGGRILFSGSTFANDIFNVQRSATVQFFFRTYLDLNFMSDSITAKTLSSISNNILFDKLTIHLDSLYENMYEGVSSRNGESRMIMKYDGTENYGLVLREKNSYKTAYIAFGLEQINSEETQDLVVEKILEWFSTPVVGVEEKQTSKAIPNEYGIDQNYPNPFNPSTVINYHLPISGNVKIVIHDALGKEVTVLVSENKNAGHHSVEFNAANLTSGIYFYSISSGSYFQVKKMMFIK